jgi:hypothetical protein
MSHSITAKKILYSLLMATALLSVPLVAEAQGLPPIGGQCGGSGQGGPSGGLEDLQSCARGQIPTAGVTGNTRADIIALIAKIIEWALYLSGAVAVVFIIIGGYRYMTAGGNEETATKARKAVVNALIGLVIIILAYVIVNVVTNFVTR